MKRIQTLILAAFSAFFMVSTLGAADLTLRFALGRSVLQTNEEVPLEVIRSATEELSAGELTLVISGEDGSRVRSVFPVPAVSLENGSARATQPISLNVRLLRPGNYSLTAEVDGSTATIPFEVYSHLRRSTYKLINWGTPQGAENQRIQGEGEDGLGYNLMYDRPRDITEYIRAGVDVIPVNIMGGGHQMDLRSDADWSDPYVIRGGTRRASRVAFQYRSFPNFIGVNFYDEPGLTWHKHPVTGEWTPHGIPSQVRSFESAHGKPAPQYHTVDPSNPESVKEWAEWGNWKLGFMDAAWREAAYGVSQVDPNLISNTQSQYGWSAFTDGYYFNVSRSLPVASGHGGYDDIQGGFFAPSFFLEMSRARDRVRPNWYLPTWWREITNDLMRVENYLSFAVGIQGIMTPPWIEPTGKTPSGKQAIIETNRVMGRLGTIFTTMENTPKSVAVLYSMSNNLDAQAKDPGIKYAHNYKHGAQLRFAYLAGQISQYPLDAIVDEDVQDGTLAAKHEAVVITGIDYLAPAVVRGLEQFAAEGGLVLLTSDCNQTIQGGVNLGVTGELPEQAEFDSLRAEIMASPTKDWMKLNPYITVTKFMEGTTPLAKAMASALAAHGIAPVFETDQPGIVAQRHGSRDIEYVFAINATSDPASKDKAGGVMPVTATLGLANDGRPVYDAMSGGLLSGTELTASGDKLVGTLAFGPGQMRVFARTAKPIGGLSVGTPGVHIDFTRQADPIRFSLMAALVDTEGDVLVGSAPLRILVEDPLGAVRYDLHRATRDGVLQLSLPLAGNDPEGQWKVTVTELLSNKTGTTTFAYAPSPQNGLVLGGVERAWMFPGEEPNLFRFARVSREVTIVPGTGDYAEAAERLKTMLAPWGVHATIVDVEQANQPRPLTEEEASTWIGITHTGKGTIKPGADNPISQVGIAARGNLILMGTPEDNALIKLVLNQSFLPVRPIKDERPGRGRGYVAWQRDAVGPGQESVTLIAHDAEGMNEAIGTFYEAVAGLQPLTPYELPLETEVTPATKK